MIYKCKLESCGKEFRGRKAADRQYCSNECSAKGRSIAPEEVNVALRCATCNSPFYLRPHRSHDGRGKFCSKQCQKNFIPCSDEAWLTQKYCIEQLPVSEIAELSSVHKGTVGRWVRRFNLSRPRLITLTTRLKKSRAAKGRKHSESTKRLIGAGQFGTRWPAKMREQERRFKRYRNGAKARGIEFHLSFDEFEKFWQQPCHYCGITVETIGLDRVDNSLGYLPTNVVPCCFTCNTMKMGLSLDVFLAHVETIRRYTGKPSNWIDRTALIGEGTVVWHFAAILADVRIGKRCSVGSFAEIGRGTVIGDESRISNGVFLPSNSVLEDRVFVGPRSVFTDDKHPRAGNFSYDAQPPYIESGASIGAGAVILPGLRLGAGCLIGAGAVVTRDVRPHEHVRGEPARAKPYSQILVEEKRLVAENAAPWPGVRGS